MNVLVAYASRHGTTEEMARHIADRLGATALDLRGHEPVPDLVAYDGIVVGSATYMFHWLGEATAFVRDNAAVLADKPVWLFSSGPLGTATVDDKGVDVDVAAEPKEIAELRDLVRARDHHVFFGALDPRHLGIRDGFIRNAMPGGKTLMEEGDFRDWAEIDAWAEAIARELAPVAVGTA